MPINRRDLLDMLDMQDSIADVAQDIVILLNIRKMKIPDELSQDVIQFVKKSQDVCYLARGLTQEFGDVIESGFGRHEIKKLLEMIDNVSIAETEADNLEDTLVGRLYEVEEKMNYVDSMKRLEEIVAYLEAHLLVTDKQSLKMLILRLTVLLDSLYTIKFLYHHL